MRERGPSICGVGVWSLLLSLCLASLTQAHRSHTALNDGKMEVMLVHRIGPERNTGSRTLICKMLRYTDRGRNLKVARGSWIEESGKEIRFAANYSNYTIKRLCSFSQAMETARKLGFIPFLIYQAKLKLSRTSEVHLFETQAKAEDFLSAQTRLAD